MLEPAMKECLLECVRSTGAILRSHFGEIREVERKESAASVVREADFAAEACIVDRRSELHGRAIDFRPDAGGVHRMHAVVGAGAGAALLASLLEIVVAVRAGGAE